MKSPEHSWKVIPNVGQMNFHFLLTSHRADTVRHDVLLLQQKSTDAMLF